MKTVHASLFASQAGQSKVLSVSGFRSTALRLSVLTAVLTVAVFGASPAQADTCDPATDPSCVTVVITNDTLPPAPLGEVVAFLDHRQFAALFFLLALSAALSVATFVWHATSPLKINGGRSV